MPQGPFFYPDPIFGWTFYAVLLGFLAVATYIDVKSLRIPKPLTLSMLAVGVVFSVVRGVWMGGVIQANDSHLVVWHFAQSPFWGAIDGLICSLEGFAAGLLLFYVLWLVKVMRGGDVKLVAALGAWVGPVIVMLVVLGTIPLMLLLGSALILRKMFRRGMAKTVINMKDKAMGDNLKKGSGGKRRIEVLLAYSLPVAVSAAVLLGALVVRDQRNPIPARPETPNQQASTPR
jgi:prepilin peptidase CpaA